MNRLQGEDESGAITVFVILMAVALLVAGGLVIDGGYALAKRRQLTNQAEQAARIGADALDTTSLRDGGKPKVDPLRARAVARNYLETVGATGTSVDIDGGVVTVTITGRTNTAILSIVGVSTIAVSGTGSAESVDQDSGEVP